jgi:hypothetical protein
VSKAAAASATVKKLRDKVSFPEHRSTYDEAQE